MVKIVSYLLMLCVVICACNNASNRGIKADTLTVADTQRNSFTPKADMGYAEETFGNDTVDNKNYAGIPYSSNMGCYGASYIDTFTEGGILFRIVHEEVGDTDIQSAMVEKFNNGRWINCILFQRYNHTGDFSRDKDVNKDGYMDITRELRFSTEVYFFNPNLKDFRVPATGYLNYDIYVIDSQRNIFCDMQEYKQMAGQIHSKLYTFKDYARYDLYDLEFYNEGEDSSNFITKLVLHKCAGGSDKVLQTVEEIKLPHPIDIDNDEMKLYTDSASYYYDYRQFWKDRYKKLL